MVIFKVIWRTSTVRLQYAISLAIGQIIVCTLKTTQSSIFQHVESKQIDPEGNLRYVQVYIECVRKAQRAFVHRVDIPVRSCSICYGKWHLVAIPFHWR